MDYDRKSVKFEALEKPDDFPDSFMKMFARKFESNLKKDMKKAAEASAFRRRLMLPAILCLLSAELVRA